MVVDSQQMAMDLFEEHRSAYLRRARAVAERLARENGTVTVNDVRAVCPPPVHIDGRVMGALFAGKHWHMTCYNKSTRKEAHCRAVASYRLGEQ